MSTTKSYEVVALPHTGHDGYRRGGQTFTRDPKTITVKTDFAGEAFDLAKRRHARALRGAERWAKDDELALDDASRHLASALEDDLEAARRAELGPDEVTEAQFEQIRSDARLRVLPAGLAKKLAEADADVKAQRMSALEKADQRKADAKKAPAGGEGGAEGKLEP